MITIETIKNRDLDEKKLRKIIALKRQNWPYPDDSQQEWIEKNLQADDFHVLVLHSDDLVAYLNLVDLQISIDEKTVKMYGIGNVCSEAGRRGDGWGRLLMSAAGCFLIDLDRPGILLCRGAVFRFYEKCGWINVGAKAEIIVADRCFTGITMGYRWPEYGMRAVYIPKSF